MMKRALVVLVLILSATSARSTTCAKPLPIGVVITPACTWIIAQVDPGVWLDNLKQYWTFPPCRPDGACSSMPIQVKLADLHIGQP